MYEVAWRHKKFASFGVSIFRDSIKYHPFHRPSDAVIEILLVCIELTPFRILRLFHIPDAVSSIRAQLPRSEITCNS